jgi:hypothetical protein
LFNFSEHTQFVTTYHLRQVLVGHKYRDLIQGREFDLLEKSFELSPYEYVWCIHE